MSLSTLQVIGLGTFERGVGSLAFSKAVGTRSNSNGIIQEVLVIMRIVGTGVVR